MTLEQVLPWILGGLLVANALLLVSIPFRARRWRRSADAHGDAPDLEPHQAAVADPEPAMDAPSAVEIEAFVASVSPDAAGSGGPIATGDGPARATSALETDGSAEAEWTSRLADPVTWSRAIREESARVARYGHPATVVMAGVPRLDSVAAAFGRGVADRVATETARLLVAEGRASDRIARVDDARFGILLLETDEDAARGYIDRVRGVADGWLESVGLSVRLSIGWASPDAGGDLTAAATAAEERMHDAARGSATDGGDGHRSSVATTSAGPRPRPQARTSG